MNDIIKVYEHDHKYYISGFDYAKLYNAEMGIDSQMGYYLVNSNILDKIRNGNYLIQEEAMEDYQVLKIQQEYTDKYGDALKRMKMFSYQDLLSWRENLEQYANKDNVDSRILMMLNEEIQKREQQQNVKDELLNKLLSYIGELKEAYGEDLVSECVGKMPQLWQKQEESSKVHK